MAAFPRCLQGALRSRGFTLTEALIVMSILTVVLSMGLPTMTIFVREQRIRAVSFELVSDLMPARSEATQRPGVTCLGGPGLGWGGGWYGGGEEGPDVGAEET